MKLQRLERKPLAGRKYLTKWKSGSVRVKKSAGLRSTTGLSNFSALVINLSLSLVLNSVSLIIYCIFQDENRYNAGRGAHLTLKRAEKARAVVNKIPGKDIALLLSQKIHGKSNFSLASHTCK